ncbi:probable integral membrane protein NMA1777 [Tritonibacter mobilis]|uniref:ABC transporter six-transmembrane domain-containing protein n=1 Tax=Tritonibacter mobilis TaxID=379347 RepID=UPI000F6CAB1F|nr:ABC transporter six-transmembrane domain-containing protein [Tritonibacter mobilis]VCU61920.1 probable integral membrane protein NMA1777 [Tritonibacter mobilis]
MLSKGPPTVLALLRAFRWRISLTWLLIFIEVALTALVPLLIGFAIDGLLANEMVPLFQLIAILVVLIVVGVIRRAYDTRVFGTMRVEMGKIQAACAANLSISTLNAQLGMGRELADFLEADLPLAMTSLVQPIISVVILYAFDPMLALAGVSAVAAMLAIYSPSHRRFYRLNGQLNQQAERQVGILETRKPQSLSTHLTRLRQIEVRISDTETIVYGAIFVVLLGLVVFNLWYATASLTITSGTIFSIVTYSWELVDAALAFPMALQGWSRLSEIMRRINPTTLSDSLNAKADQ